jgi:4-amino-4-deoxy-L-arabinose transferase-like glycosyltransferase
MKTQAEQPASAPPPQQRKRRTLRPPPAALTFLLATTLVLGCVWALVLPPFQAPDENAHVAYVQSLAERGKLPGDPGLQFQSTEQTSAAEAANTDQTAQQLFVKPEWSERRYDRWLEQAAQFSSRQREDGGGANPAGPNPPLYYLWLVGPYDLAADGDLFARISAMRLASVPFLLATVIATWLLAGVVFGRNRPLQLAAASVPALAPMVTFVSSSVTPDALLYALWGFALWLGARLVKGDGDLRDVVAICVVAALAVLTKATSYALLPAVAVAVATAALRAGGGPRRLALTAAVAAASFALVAAPWYVAARLEDRPAAGQLAGGAPAESVDAREFGSYVWQYYLPRLPFQARYGALGRYPQAYETWFKQSIGAFGWLETRWPNPVYRVLFLVAALILAGAVVAPVRRRRSVDPMLLVFFGTAMVVLIAGLHWNEYRLAEGSGSLASQGRYLFPLIPLAGLVVAAAVTALPARLRPLALGATVGGLATLQLFAIALVVTRFYA